jgi:hypothetical protein
MNELDLFVVLRDTSDSAALHFMNFVAGLFAFLLASHFIAARLSRINFGILIGLFSAFSLLSCSAAVIRFRATSLIFEQLSALASPNAATLAATFGAAPYVPTIVSIVLFLGYVAGIAFLFESRRASRTEG